MLIWFFYSAPCNGFLHPGKICCCKGLQGPYRLWALPLATSFPCSRQQTDFLFSGTALLWRLFSQRSAWLTPSISLSLCSKFVWDPAFTNSGTLQVIFQSFCSLKLPMKDAFTPGLPTLYLKFQFSYFLSLTPFSCYTFSFSHSTYHLIVHCLTYLLIYYSYCLLTMPAN